MLRRNSRIQVEVPGSSWQIKVGIPDGHPRWEFLQKFSILKSAEILMTKYYCTFWTWNFFGNPHLKIPTPNPQMGFPGRNPICIIPAGIIEYVYNLKPRKIGIQWSFLIMWKSKTLFT